LLDYLQTFNFWLKDVDDFLGSDFVDLVEVTDSSLNEFDEDKSLDNSVSSGPDLD
jgi:hypothetical protein